MPCFVSSNHLGPFDNESISGFKDEVFTREVWTQVDFFIVGFKASIKQVLVVAGHSITAAKSEVSRLITHEAWEKDGPKKIIYFLDNPSLELSDVLAHPSPLREWELLRTTFIVCSIDVFMDGLHGFIKEDTNFLNLHFALISSWRSVVYSFQCIMGIYIWNPQYGLMEIVISRKRNLWKDKDSIFSFIDVVPILTSHLMVPFSHQLMDWRDASNKRWFNNGLKFLEGMFPALGMNNCHIMHVDFQSCSSYSTPCMLIFLKSDFNWFTSDVIGS